MFGDRLSIHYNAAGRFYVHAGCSRIFLQELPPCFQESAHNETTACGVGESGPPLPFSENLSEAMSRPSRPCLCLQCGSTSTHFSMHFVAADLAFPKNSYEYVNFLFTLFPDIGKQQIRPPLKAGTTLPSKKRLKFVTIGRCWCFVIQQWNRWSLSLQINLWLQNLRQQSPQRTLSVQTKP